VVQLLFQVSFVAASRYTNPVTNTCKAGVQDAVPWRIAISILAGGQSARMGRDKARLRFGGRTLIGHVRAAAEATGWRVRVIRRDAVPRCGPVGGIYTALKTSKSDAELFLACDMPFISPVLLKELLKRSGPKQDAVFATADGQPGFPCLLRVSALPVVEKQIQSKQFSLHALAEVLRAKLLRLPKGRAMELWNINTPEDWQKARLLVVVQASSLPLRASCP
jgi:molybdopterin-guanine dinucleotide biosynthesis protein A